MLIFGCTVSRKSSFLSSDWLNAHRNLVLVQDSVEYTSMLKL